MKFTFETAQKTPKAGLTGLVLKSPYSPQSLQVPAQSVRDLQEFRHMVEKMNRSYDAQTVDNFTRDLRGTYGSATSEIIPSKYATRARGRTLTKDTSHGKGINRIYADNVVGDDPFELEMEVGKVLPDGSFEEEKDTNRAIESAWQKFCRKENFTVRKNMGFMEAMRVVEMARAHPGSVIGWMHAEYPFNEFGFAMDFLEEDRLQEQFNGVSGDDSKFGRGNPIRASVEYHPRYNFPLAYWILTRHPGDYFGQTTIYNEKVYREQVPASKIIHFNNLLSRPEQDMGMTELDATILPLWRIHQYDKSLTLSSIASASKPWWIEEAKPTGLELPGELRELVENWQLNGGGNGNTGMDVVKTQQGGGNPTNTITPASREKLPPGMTLKQGDPRFPIEAAHEFRNDNLRDISVGTFGSYQQLSGDYQSLGFIAGLMSQQAFQRNVRVRQKSLAEDLRTLFRNWLQSAILKGYFDKQGVAISLLRLEEYVDGANFKGQQAEFVNPLVQAQALILLNEAKHMTRQGVQDALPNGMKVDKLVKQLAQERKEFVEAGLPDPDEEIATEPNINHEGSNAPGSELPEPAAGKEGGAAKVPSKSKVQSPHSRNRLRGTIDDTTRALIAMSENGHH